MEKFKFKKHFGQNFLTDTNILNKIIKAITPSEKDLIIEIGAGGGALTKELKKYNCQVLSYEIDLDTQKYLEPLIDEKTTIIFDDFLKRNVPQDLANLSFENTYIIANLPYYITTPIIEKIIKTNIKPKKMLLMVQKEVAERLSAVPGTRDYGFITVYLNYYFKINKLFNVNKCCFFPIPKVDSAIIELTSHQEYADVDETKLTELLKAAFKHKRKNLNNNLQNYDKEKVSSILLKSGYSLSSRAEELSIEVFVEITNAL